MSINFVQEIQIEDDLKVFRALLRSEHTTQEMLYQLELLLEIEREASTNWSISWGRTTLSISKEKKFSKLPNSPITM